MKQARILTAEEFKRVLAVIDAHKHSERNRAIFHLSFLGGLRACEIAALKISDVVDEDGQVKTQIVLQANMTKGQQRNRVIVSTALQTAIKRYIRAHSASKAPNTPLIVSQKGGSFSPLTIVQLFAKFYKKAGISGASSHSGRRQFITALAENQINVRVIQALARHQHVNTTMRYIDVNDVKLANAVEVVAV
jgi:integrase/recombinase XerD